MTFPIRNTFWAYSGMEQSVEAAMSSCMTKLNQVVAESLGENAIPISLDHQLTVYGRDGGTAPAFVRSIFKDTPITPSHAQYQVTATAIYEPAPTR